MIPYNFRHRGAYEYDKFVLNIFQFHNEVVLLHGKIFEEGANDKDNLNELNDLINQNFNEATGEQSLSNNIYKTKLFIE